MKCWHISYSDDSIAEVKKLRQIQGVTVVQLDKLLEEKKYRYFDRKLPSDKEDTVNAFERWLKSQRYSEKSIASYVHAIRTLFGYFSNKGIHEISNGDVKAFNYDYILRNKLSISYLNQTISAIKLFYSVMLNKDLVIHEIVRPRKAHSLPGIFSKTEVESLIRTMRNPKHKAMLALIYACGLRRNELIALKINSIDSKRKLLIIKAGKGNKDRLVPIPEKMIGMLRAYYISYRPKYWFLKTRNLVSNIQNQVWREFSNGHSTILA
jgi:integrase/recombinase XerD